MEAIETILASFARFNVQPPDVSGWPIEIKDGKIFVGDVEWIDADTLSEFYSVYTSAETAINLLRFRDTCNKMFDSFSVRTTAPEEITAWYPRFQAHHSA
jgi:hypothetical protein